MKKHFFTLVVMALCAIGSYGQETAYRWGKWTLSMKNWGSNADVDRIMDTYVDEEGNSYVYGQMGMMARLGENGDYICPMDTADGYRVETSTGVFLAKIDSAGNVLWCKSARCGSTNSHCLPWNNMVVREDRITIAFGCTIGGELWNWMYFFDTMLYEPSDHNRVIDRHTYFVTFDMAGNMVERHDMQLMAYNSPSYDYLRPSSLDIYGSNRSCFVIDKEGGVHIFACGSFGGDDTLHRAYVTVDGDTNERYYIDIETQDGVQYSSTMYYRMDREWRLSEARFLIDSVAGWTMTEGRMANVEIKDATLDGEYIYVNGLFSMEMFDLEPDSMDVKVFFDTAHYVRIDNTYDINNTPFVMKIGMDGDIEWLQQLYTEKNGTFNTMDAGGLALDEGKVYACYNIAVNEGMRYYIDGGLERRIVTGESSTCAVVVYDSETGEAEDYYVADTVELNYSTNSMAIVGDEVVMVLSYPRLWKTEMCKINKWSKAVDKSMPIRYNSTALCMDMALSSSGWVLRGETGNNPIVDGVDMGGNNQRVSVMTLLYDSLLDMRRLQYCQGVSQLRVEECEERTVTLAWSSHYYHPGYEVAYVAETGSWDEATVVEVADTMATVVMPDAQRYLFRVRALCDGDGVTYSPWSDIIAVDSRAGIGEVDNMMAIRIYPNPTNGTVHIKSPYTIESAMVSDLSGRGEAVSLVHVGGGHYTLDMSMRVQGPYFLTLTDADGEKHIVKLIKKD